MARDDVLAVLRRFRQRKQDEYRIIRIGIFGSAARDEMRDDSDVDVVVELAAPDLFAVIGIKQDLEEVLHRTVDVVRLRSSMNRSLKQRIEQEAVYV